MVRVLTSLNWALGTLAICGALIGPAALGALTVDPARRAAEAKVEEILKAQTDHLHAYNRYVPFSNNPAASADALKRLKLQIPPGEFVFDAFPENGTALVIRAITSSAAMASGKLPPLLYRLEVKAHGGEGTGQWVALSGKSNSVLALADTFKKAVATVRAMF